jgi:predicted GNAT family acetyltransferase
MLIWNISSLLLSGSFGNFKYNSVTMKNIHLLFALAVLASCSSNSDISIPSESLNEVLHCKDAKGLVSKYGAKSVILDTSIVLGDDTLKGAIIYPGTPKQANVFFHEGKISDVSIQGESSAWKTSSGLYLGLTLQEVEKINAKNFTISGFGWAHGGSVVSWEGGKLAGDSTLTHVVSFRNKRQNISVDEFTKVSGEAEFDVRHPSIQQMNPVLEQITILKPYTPSKEEGKGIAKKIESSQIPVR